MESIVASVIVEGDKLLTTRTKYNYFVQRSLGFDNDSRKKFEIMALFFKQYTFRSNDLANWKNMSEYSIIIKIWSSIFEIMFEGEDHINLNWGETKNDEFKVVLRICLLLDNINYDLSNIEFKKNGDTIGSRKEDHGKVLVEGKTILNKLINIHNRSFKEAKEMKVIVAQFCGSKGVFRRVQLAAPGA